ncbi:hypothetical protein SISNIDRAFT_470807 [Sistotremastrum niveocremeum HHB9708]|uniref:DUF6533 domain-containing protein n=1 Tax=Sistotremastrum niveocremeum HHB9708 TaxID=1314777 RepID=A0A164NFI3_9AGAM|nr:hypothetical protein SISNIDRAFT_470807 [Sistotremastrum niveocremeum HHB9708]
MINGNPSDAGIALANLASTEVPAYVVVFLYTVRYKMRACALSAMVVMVHDIISTLEDEVKHFWRKGWSLHKVLYFLCTSLISMYISIHLRFCCERCPLVFVIALGDSSFLDRCEIGFRWQTFGAMFQHWTVQAVLCQIVRSLYFNSRPMVVVWLAFLIQIAIVYPFWPDKSFKMCSFRLGTGHLDTMWIYWIPAIGFDALLFVFCMLRLRSVMKDENIRLRDFFRERRRTMTLMEVIIRDTMWYFSCAFVINLATCLIMRFGLMASTYMGGFSGAAFSFIGTRIVFLLREADDRKVRGTLDSTFFRSKVASEVGEDSRGPQHRRRRRRHESTQEISQPMAFRKVDTITTEMELEAWPISALDAVNEEVDFGVHREDHDKVLEGEVTQDGQDNSIEPWAGYGAVQNQDVGTSMEMGEMARYRSVLDRDETDATGV